MRRFFLYTAHTTTGTINSSDRAEGSIQIRNPPELLILGIFLHMCVCVPGLWRPMRISSNPAGVLVLPLSILILGKRRVVLSGCGMQRRRGGEVGRYLLTYIVIFFVYTTSFLPRAPHSHISHFLLAGVLCVNLFCRFFTSSSLH